MVAFPSSHKKAQGAQNEFALLCFSGLFVAGL